MYYGYYDDDDYPMGSGSDHEKKKAEKGPQWKNTTKKKKIQYKFTTVDELKESGGYGQGFKIK